MSGHSNNIIIKSRRSNKITPINEVVLNDNNDGEARIVQEFDGFAEIEKFFENKYIFISKNFNDYCNGIKSTKRIIILKILKTILFSMSLRFTILAFFGNNPMIEYIFSDTFSFSGNKKLFCFSYSITTLIAFLLISVIQYFEYYNRFYCFELLNNFRHKKNGYQLNELNEKKFKGKIDFFGKHFLRKIFFLIFYSFSPLIFVSTLISYQKNSDQLSLYSSIFWLICTIVWIHNSFVLVLVIFTFFYLTTIFLRYQFQEINQQFIKSIENNDTNSIINGIIKHFSVIKSTEKVNQSFKYIIFILFYMYSTNVNIFIFLILDKNTNISFKIVRSLTLIIFISMLFLENYLCASVSKTAHKSQSNFYKLFIRKQINLRAKLKILTFIEILSGPEIGIYCYEFFPMNNLEFFNCVIIVAINYLLISQLINKL